MKLNLNSNFNNYYSGSYLTFNNNQLRLILNSLNYYIHFCTFFSLSSTIGGSIYCINQQCQLLIEETTFSNIFTTNGYGGAIYFLPNIGTISLYKICGNKCFTPSNQNGQFSYQYTTSNLNNFVNYISIQFCSPNTNNGITPIYFWDGNISFLNSNCSNNYVESYSSMVIDVFINSTLNFLTITNNFALNKHCLYLYRSFVYISLINFINNSQNFNNNGHFFLNGGTNTIILKSIFLNNNNILFENIQGSLKIIECWSNNFNFINIITPIFISTNSITNTFFLNHFNTFICRNLFFSKLFEFKISFLFSFYLLFL